MKSYILICCLCISGCLADKSSAEIKKECRKSIGITTDDVNAIKTSTLPAERQKVFADYMTCYFLNGGMVDENGHFNIEAMKKNVEPEHLGITVPVLEACINDEGTNPLESLTKLILCSKEKSGNVLFETLDLF